MDYKVHNSNGELIASCRHAEDAAALVALNGRNARIKVGGRVVWREGFEQQDAAESYDYVAAVVLERHRAHRQAAFERAHKRAVA